MYDTPILLIVFNRPEVTEKVFSIIRKLQPKSLFIAADGPREDKVGERDVCQKVRQIVLDIDWNCEIKTLFRNKNLGCRVAVSSAIQWFFEHVEEGIILEDDCLPHPDFFSYASILLEKYRNNEKIISINGSNLGYNTNGDYDYSFSRFMNMWGWATWKRSAMKIDYELKDWTVKKYKLLSLYNKMRLHIFDLDIEWYKYWMQRFEQTARNEIDTWDYQWIFYQLNNKKLSIVPTKNLVSNIGFDNGATHTFDKNHQAANLHLHSINLPLRHPSKLKMDGLYEEKYVKEIWCGHTPSPFLSNFRSLIREILKYFGYGSLREILYK
jgi:hypothetical protein